MTDDSTPEGTVEQAEPVNTADSLLDRFLGSSDDEDTPQEQEDSTEEQSSEDEDADTDLSADDAGQDDDAEQQEGDQSQEEASAGRFVGDDGKVRLPDGTVTTVAELKRGSLREADYTRKTQEVSALRRELDTRDAELTQRSQLIDFAIAVAQANTPAEPDTSMLNTDPLGYMQQKAQFDERKQQLQQLYAAKQAHETAQSQVQQQAFQQWAERERNELVNAMPELRDPAKARQFNADLVAGIQRYGFGENDLSQVYDHRLILLARDAMAYQKLMANKPKAMAKTAGKPPIAPGVRASPQGEKSRNRQADWKKLRSSGGRDADALDRILDDLI